MAEDNDNWFDVEQENSVHDAFLMVADPDCEHESIRDVIINETTFTEENCEMWEEKYNE